MIEFRPNGLGAAILGVLAAGKEKSGFSTPSEAIAAMAGQRPGRESRIVKPNKAAGTRYEEIYGRYRKLADLLVSS